MKHTGKLNKLGAGLHLFMVIGAILPLLGAGCMGKVSKSEPLGCMIRGDLTCELGKAPIISVTITNRTNTDIYLVGSLDGSEGGWRYPYCYFEVTGPDGKILGKLTHRQCGNMNGLREKDFMKVPPGSTFNPYQFIDDLGFFYSVRLNPVTFPTTGEYHIRFVYSTKSGDIAEWAGDRYEGNIKELRSMLRQVPKVEIASNEIKITVVASRLPIAK